MLAAQVLAPVLWSDPASAAGNGSGGGGGGNGGNGGGGGGNSGGGGGNSGGGGGNSGGGGGNSNAGAGNSNAGGNGKSNAGGNGKGKPAEASASAPADGAYASSLREAGAIRPLADVYNVAERQFDGEVIDAKLMTDGRQGWTYDVRVVTEDGYVHDVSYNAVTLAVLAVDGEPVK